MKTGFESFLWSLEIVLAMAAGFIVLALCGLLVLVYCGASLSVGPWFAVLVAVLLGLWLVSKKLFELSPRKSPELLCKGERPSGTQRHANILGLFYACGILWLVEFLLAVLLRFIGPYSHNEGGVVVWLFSIACQIVVLIASSIAAVLLDRLKVRNGNYSSRANGTFIVVTSVALFLANLPYILLLAEPLFDKLKS